ncbi:thiamine-phosphate kinase [Telmatospirillum sp. J64-1]|uniref:thiamine-phosphate kinase n=1 Tax=Telmatospirillum sp. J64-1 TaxID=2502183 RepID=UPI00115C6060|nr:thiamine-phosphate kinase [Telmatospirillum sp. J64-1]
MPGLDEFSLIEEFFAPLAAGCPGALGLKDDAALLSVPPGRQLVVTSDAVVAGVHFLPDDPADLVARKVLRTNLSDLAAMGASPVGLMLAAAFPRDTGEDWLRLFASGLAADVAEFAVPLIGGDTVSTPGPLTLTVTALGTVGQGCELRRSRAQLGDTIWVSGSLGDSALGLKVLQGQVRGLAADHAAFLADRYRLPRPRLALGACLHGLATAAMDISDGLCADLAHICRASGVKAEIHAERLPLSPAARAALELTREGLAPVLSGGDDYELLFTAPAGQDAAVAALADRTGVELTAIGRVTGQDGDEPVVVYGGDGVKLFLGRAGWRHFEG